MAVSILSATSIPSLTLELLVTQTGPLTRFLSVADRCVSRAAPNSWRLITEGGPPLNAR
jgi:hypothetical protein